MKRIRLIGRVVPRHSHGYGRMVMALQTKHALPLILMIRLSRSKTPMKGAVMGFTSPLLVIRLPPRFSLSRAVV